MMETRAFVCGASQGIGEATALKLAGQGCKVTVFSRSEDRLKALVHKLPGPDHDYVVGDIGNPDSWASQVEERHGQSPYGILICNSGGPPAGKISEATSEDFLAAMTNHLVANSRLMNIFLASMKNQKFGRIVTVTSTSVKVPIPHLGVSNTARAAVASWGKTLSLEVAPFGITVNNVMPGFTETPRLEKLIAAKADATGQSKEAVRKAWTAMVPLGRFCRPEETADLIGFLCAGNAGAITGQNIAVDGGRLGCL